MLLPKRTAVLVNTDFLARPDAPGYACDAAVLDTARAILDALRYLDVEVEQIEVAQTLDGLPGRLRGLETVFNLIESIDGDYGREWEVPALLDRLGVRYTGNGLRTLQLCQEKDHARRLLIEAGVRVAPGAVVEDTVPALSYPCFVKPARVDGSIGVDAASCCADEAALRTQLAKLRAALPGPFLVEEYLPGKEINVALFPEPKHGHVVPTEIDFSVLPPGLPRFVTYDSKWNPQSPEYVTRSVPAVLDVALRREVEELARTAFVALHGSSYGRVDMRLDRDGRPCVIDVNPNNDLHPDAGLALAARSVGVDYPTLIGGILACAHHQGER